jgi:hypothetical protein
MREDEEAVEAVRRQHKHMWLMRTPLVATMPSMLEGALMKLSAPRRLWVSGSDSCDTEFRDAVLSAVISLTSSQPLHAPRFLHNLLNSMSYSSNNEEEARIVSGILEILRLCPCLLGGALHDALMDELAVLASSSPRDLDTFAEDEGRTVWRLQRLASGLVMMAKRLPLSLCRILPALIHPSLAVNDTLTIAAMRCIMTVYYHSCSKGAVSVVEKAVVRAVMARQNDDASPAIMLLLLMASAGGKDGMVFALSLAQELTRREILQVAATPPPPLQYPYLFAALLWLQGLSYKARSGRRGSNLDGIRWLLNSCVELHREGGQRALHCCAAAAAALHECDDEDLISLQAELCLAFDYPGTSPLNDLNPDDPWARPREIRQRLVGAGMLRPSAPEARCPDVSSHRHSAALLNPILAACGRLPRSWALARSSLHLLSSGEQNYPWSQPLLPDRAMIPTCSALSAKLPLRLNMAAAPPDILNKVFVFVGVKRLCRIMCVSRSWAKAAAAPALWERHYHLRWPLSRRLPSLHTLRTWQKRRRPRRTFYTRGESGCKTSDCARDDWMQIYIGRVKAERIARVGGSSWQPDTVCPFLACGAVMKGVRGEETHISGHLLDQSLPASSNPEQGGKGRRRRLLQR